MALATAAPSGSSLDARRPSATLPVWALAVAVGVAALALTIWAVAPLSAPGSELLAWPILAIAFVVAERVIVHFEFRHDSHAVSFSAVPLVVGLFTVDPLLLVGLAVGGLTLALAVRRQSPLKLIVNVAAAWINVAVTVWIFRLLVELPAPEPSTWLPAVLAVVAGDFVQAVVISAAIALHQRALEIDATVLTLGAFQAVANTAIALVGVSLLVYEPLTLLLLAALLPVLYVSYRVHARLREQHQNLAELYEFGRSSSEAVLQNDVVTALLRGVTELMHADSAWLLLESESGEVTILRGDGSSADRASDDSAAARLHRAAQASAEPSLVRHGDGNDAADALTGLGISEALISPIAGASGSSATIVAADRSGDVRPFGQRDLTLFATVVNHASASLENSRLLDRLREEAATNEYQATHDLLTGLPNREAFQDEVNAALQRHPVAGVVLLDLDRFKEVNDTLGHHNGDLLLKEVGGRLRSVLREGDVVARLGGDEFGVLLTGLRSKDAATTAARAIPSAFDRPFEVGGMTIAVGASVGLTVAPDHGTDAATLLQRADVAMYSCKASGAGVELYRPEADEHSAARLMLATELRGAIESEELEVYFQPQVEMKTGHPMGAEALIRWPRMQGTLNPAELVSLAEHTGQIWPLTALVLKAAARECRRWWDLGWPIRVSVNFSARSLTDEGLVDEVTRILAEANLPPSGLCVELTETTIVAERHRVVPVLERLRGLGVSVAIDDFGTGYSSLAYLARLPIDEIKVDKSFVMDMATDAHADAIVRTILDLAVNLGLPVVAEGIENEEARLTLAERGCASGQGYFFSRPVPAEDFINWLLRDRSSSRLATGAPVNAPRLRPEQR